jgi:hypothetical protein
MSACRALAIRLTALSLAIAATSVASNASSDADREATAMRACAHAMSVRSNSAQTVALDRQIVASCKPVIPFSQAALKVETDAQKRSGFRVDIVMAHGFVLNAYAELKDPKDVKQEAQALLASAKSVSSSDIAVVSRQAPNTQAIFNQFVSQAKGLVGK